jgi:hypothetical protein
MGGIFSSKAAAANFSGIPRKAEARQDGYEFETYAQYALAFGGAAMSPQSAWDGSDAAWLRSDREHLQPRWKKAVVAITKGQLQDRLQPFSQILQYYKSIHLVVDLKGHAINWTKGAVYLVKDLTDTYDVGVTTGNWSLFQTQGLIELKPILSILNRTIANFAITKFYDLLYGAQQTPLKTGKEAFKFDKEFIEQEQRDMAFPAYAAAHAALPAGLSVLNDFFNRESFWILIREVFLHYDSDTAFVPVFPDLYDSNLTVDGSPSAKYIPLTPSSTTTRFGQEARVQVPLLMLYPNNDLTADTEFQNEPAVLEIKRGNAKGDNPVFADYQTANKRIVREF